MQDLPETPEGVALYLTQAVIRAEGTPLETLSEDTKPTFADNRPVRSYVLYAYAECLSAATGKRGIDPESLAARIPPVGWQH